MKIIKIYTDGAYKPSTNIGAAAFLIYQDNQFLCESAKSYNDVDKNSSNCMELQAAINAFNWLRSSKIDTNNVIIYVYTDSQIVQVTMSTWIHKWKENNWKNSRNRTPAHIDMWIYFYNLLQNHFGTVYFNWIEGHNGDENNTRVDKLCKTVINAGKYEKIKIYRSGIHKFRKPS